MDKIAAIGDRHLMTDVQLSLMFSICDLTTVVHLILCEIDGDPSIHDSIADMLFGDFQQEIAQDIIEELTDYINSGNRPQATDYLLSVIRHDPAVSLASVIPVREEDLMIYSFERLP